MHAYSSSRDRLFEAAMSGTKQSLILSDGMILVSLHYTYDRDIRPLHSKSSDRYRQLVSTSIRSITVGFRSILDSFESVTPSCLLPSYRS